MPPPDKSTTHLKIGVVTRPHGVRGELKVRMFHEESEALQEVTHVVLESPKGEANRYEIRSVRGNSKTPIVDLFGVEGRDGADALRGCSIWVERGALPPLETGEYYLVDLVGCDVYLNGIVYAKVTDVRPDPSVDTMVIRLESGKKADVPIVDAWVGNVDIEARRVELLSEDGVIES